MTPPAPIALPAEAMLAWSGDSILHRIYWRRGRDGSPRQAHAFATFSASNRFDVPGETMLYAAAGLPGALLETLLRPRAGAPGRVHPLLFVERRELSKRAAARLLPPRPLTLLKLFDSGLHALGLDAGVGALRDYAATQAVAADLHATYDVDGFAWRSRLNNEEIAVVLFGGRVGAPLVVQQDTPLDASDLLPEVERVCRAHRCILTDSGGPPPPLDEAG